ncbi:hypothetical protein GF314_00900 [bacterium]|nr:hypothetical protein [bacterium]
MTLFARPPDPESREAHRRTYDYRDRCSGARAATNPIPVRRDTRRYRDMIRSLPRSLAIWLLLAAPAVAQQPTLPPLARAVLDSAVTVELASLPGAPLTLDEARRLARGGATQLRIADATADAARGALRSERGDYQPELYGEGLMTRDEAPATNPFSGVDIETNEQTRGEAGLRWRAPLGTQVEASLNAVRTETNSGFTLLDPQYDAFGEIRVTQPLLEGFGVGERGGLTAAERRLEAAEARREGARVSVESLVDAAYWTLYATGRDFSVQRLITERAEALLEQAETRRRAGLVGPADVASARVFLAQQRQAELDAWELLGEASDALAGLIGARPADGYDLYRPVDEPPADFPVPDADTLVTAAEAGNHELRGLEREVAAVRAQRDQAGRNALPSLDVFGAIGGAGLTGTPQEVAFGDTIITTPISGGLADGLGEALRREYGNWQVGLTFAVPIGNGQDGGERDRLGAEVVRAEQQYEAARRRLEEDVRAAHRALASGRDRLEVARFGVAAASEQVRIGVLDYENGRTSAFELVRLAGDLAAAEQSYSRALVRTARAAAALRQLTGGAYPSEEIDQ